MRIDRYIKIVLTVIAIALTTIACSSLVHPSGVAAEGPFAGVQASAGMGGILLFDTKTGQMWIYENKRAEYAGRITKLGEPPDMTLPKN
jgi:hypothetical protein